MTIAISLKVNDGVVLASDSAATLQSRDANGNVTFVNVYNNANKIFNLVRGVPVGAVVYGSGSIGTTSMATIAKDLRKRLTTASDASWHVDKDAYTVLDVAEKLKRFVFDELYEPTFKAFAEKPSLGVYVAGYSSGEAMAEEFAIQIENGTCRGPIPMRPKGETGVSWGGQPQALQRLIFGVDAQVIDVMEKNMGVPRADAESAFGVFKAALSAPLVISAMPIQDAIDLAEFFVDVSCKYSRFAPGAQTVGGPIEIAAITKHEGFKWVRRKHYYPCELNPEVKS